MDGSNKNEYLHTMKPMFYLLRLTGVLPYRLRHQECIPRFVSSKIISFGTIVAYVLFLIQIGNLTIELFKDERNVNSVVLVAKAPEISFEIFCFMMPFLMWNRTKQIQDYWTAWENFQSEYESVHGKPFESKKKKNVKIAAIFCVLSLTVRNFYAFVYHQYAFPGPLAFAVNFYLLLLLYVVSTYWYANCVYLRSMSKDILLLGKEIINEKKDDRKLNKLISVWLTLCDLTNHFNASHSFLFLTYVLLVVISIVTYAYAVLNYSTYYIVYPLTWYLNALFISVVFLLMICETAHLVYHQINYRQKETLLLENTMKMEVKILESVLRFLRTINLRNPSINLNGFFTLNRVEFPVIVAVCVNYLIVLRQFSEIQIPEPILQGL